jgi:hypothetical protein
MDQVELSTDGVGVDLRMESAEERIFPARNRLEIYIVIKREATVRTLGYKLSDPPSLMYLLKFKFERSFKGSTCKQHKISNNSKFSEVIKGTHTTVCVGWGLGLCWVS